MMSILRHWLMRLEGQFSARELDYMTAEAATIRLQLRDAETGCLHLHEVCFTGKDAHLLALKKST